MLRTNSVKTHTSLEQLATAIPLAVVVSDADRKIEIVNPHAEALLGLPAAELVGQPVDRLIADRQEIQSAGPSNLSCASGVYRRLGSGPSIPIEMQSSVLSFGPDTYELHCLTDLAQRGHAEDLEQRMAALVESADDAIITKSLDGIIRTWNPAAERLLGYTAAEIIGESIVRLIPEDRQDEEAMIINQIQQGKRVSHFETRRLRKDGTTVEVSLMISPIRDRQGAVVGASKIVRDLSQRLNTERQLRQTNAELELKNAELDDFVYTASHDLRAPLMSAGSVVNWIIEDDPTLSVETRGRLAILQQRIERMSRLLCDIRDHARLGRSSDTSGEVMTASSLVKDIIGSIEVPAGFTIRCDAALDAVKVARAPLERVLENLIVNAIRHHDRSEGHISVSITPAAEFHRFWVTDDGPGIPEEYRETIFGLFQTLKPRDEVEGSGMGLAIVRKIVSRMGGTCGVSPADIRGSHFWFDWPRLPDPQSP